MPQTIGRRSFLAGAAVIPLPAAALPEPATPADGPSLARAAAAGGRYFGAAARIDQIRSERRLREVMVEDCSWITPEIHMNWDQVEREPGRFDFGPADDLVAFAYRNGLRVRGHTMLWDQSTPAWAKAAMLHGADWRPLARYIAAAGARYEGQVFEWEVVNEPIDDAGDLRANVFRRAFGPDYIRRALEEARDQAPDARLAINDYGFDYDNAVEETRRTAFLRLLEGLVSAGAPLDAVGVQAHLDLGKGPIKPQILAPFFQNLADLGLKISITELDVQERDFSAPVSTRDARVADEVRAYLEIALDQPAVEGVVTWGLSDRHSWLQESEATTPGAFNRGLPYDAALERKPMYWAIRETLAAQRRT